MNRDEIRADARGAKDLLSDPTFVKAKDGCLSRLLSQLMLAQDDRVKLDLVAQMQAIKSVTDQLQTFLNNEAVAQRKQNG